MKLELGDTIYYKSNLCRKDSDNKPPRIGFLYQPFDMPGSTKNSCWQMSDNKGVHNIFLIAQSVAKIQYSKMILIEKSLPKYDYDRDNLEILT
jgi:hypothetical protein